MFFIDRICAASMSRNRKTGNAKGSGLALQIT
jgi:hypothetical protein